MKKSVQHVLGLTIPLLIGPPALTPVLTAGTVPPEPRIIVRLYNYTAAPDETIQQAKDIAARIFDKAEVELEWLDCFSSNANEELHPSCHQPPTAGAINVRLAEQSAHPEIFECGLAIPANQGRFSKHAIVFYRCVKTLTLNEGSTRAAVLGHMIAHEIGHMLLGLGSHSSEGIMRYPWGRTEVELADKGWLRFTPRQARRMRAQVRARMHACARQPRSGGFDVE